MRIAAAGVLVGAIGVLALWQLVLHDRSTPVSVQDAVSRLGDARPAASVERVNGVRVPASGVYSYATTGEERLDAILDATHAYPEVTTITVSPGGCGLLMRWAPLRERETEYELCPGRRSWRLASFFEVHRFFGQEDRRRYVCPRGVAFKRSGRWRYTCTYEETTDDFSGEVVGVETVRVGGESVEAIHVRERDVLSGTEEGTGEMETWYRRDGLILRRIGGTDDLSPAPGGTANYIEDYELRLLSLTPAG